MKHCIGNWLNAHFATKVCLVIDEDRGYYDCKILYWDTYVHYVTELDCVPLGGYWYSRTYFGVYNNPAIDFAQGVWV